MRSYISIPNSDGTQSRLIDTQNSEVESQNVIENKSENLIEYQEVDFPATTDKKNHIHDNCKKE